MITYSNVLKTMYRGQMTVRERSKLIKKDARVKKKNYCWIQGVGAVCAGRCVAMSACEGGATNERVSLISPNAGYGGEGKR